MLFYVFLLINIIAFVRVAADKKIARKTEYKTKADNQRRKTEVSFIAWAAFGGAAGTLLAMQIYKHKTAKAKSYLRTTLFLLLLQNIIFFALLIAK